MPLYKGNYKIPAKRVESWVLDYLDLSHLSRTLMLPRDIGARKFKFVAKNQNMRRNNDGNCNTESRSTFEFPSRVNLSGPSLYCT